MRTIVIGAAAALLLWTGGAAAIPFSGTASGSWTGVVSTNPTDVYAVANNDHGGAATFEWGVPSSTPFPSGFAFDGVGSDGDPGWSAQAESPFAVGWFTYTNGSTLNSLGIEGATLNIELAFSEPEGLAGSFLFPFVITNTMNWTGDPYLDRDFVTAGSSLPPAAFFVDGVGYTLELLGFSSDGGANIRTDFSSPEGATAAAGVYARITSRLPPDAVPEPGAALFLLAGMAAAALSRRARRP